MIQNIMAIGPNGILVSGVVMALLVILTAFHKELLGAMGIHLKKRRRMLRRRNQSIRMDITSVKQDDA